MADLDRWSTLDEVQVPLRLILVVDDDPVDAAAIKHVFEAQQATVRIAKDGGQAQSSFVMHKPDLVILDLILPGESGFEIAERMKHTDDTVPLLALTAITLDDSRDLARRVGFDGYVNKPIDPETLWGNAREVVQQVWRRVHLQEEPTVSAETDRIRFNCICGKKFKVSATHRGKNMTCPQCGEPLTVPRQ